MLTAGYAKIWQGQQALDTHEQTQCEHMVLPGEVTFWCLLNLYGHLGPMDKGQELFDSMEVVYNLKRDV